jgi:hypothetical protein
MAMLPRRHARASNLHRLLVAYASHADSRLLLVIPDVFALYSLDRPIESCNFDVISELTANLDLKRLDIERNSVLWREIGDERHS